MRLKTAQKKAKQNKGSGGGNYLEWKDDGQVDIWIGCNDPDNQVAMRHVHFIPYENDDGEIKKAKVVCDSDCMLDKFLGWLKSEKDIDEDEIVWSVAGEDFTKTDLLKWEGGDWRKAMWPKSETLFTVVVEEDGEFINKILPVGPGLFESITDVIEEYEAENNEDFFEEPCCIRLIYKEKASPAKKYRAKEVSKKMPDEVKELLDSGDLLEPDDFVEYTDQYEIFEHIQANLDSIDWEPDTVPEKKKSKKKKKNKDKKDDKKNKDKKDDKKNKKEKPPKENKKKEEPEEEKPSKKKRPAAHKPVKKKPVKKKRGKKNEEDVTVTCPNCNKETSLNEDDCEHCGENIVGF